MGVRLVWDGKTAEVPRLRLPLQVVETVNSPRADRGTIFEGAGEDDGWRNQLIWGDNLHALASLADELAGQVDLVYIDPPFDSRRDYKVRIAVGDEGANAEQELAKIESIVEEKAYRDTWGAGRSSYLSMLAQRLVLIRELLSPTGSLYIHLDHSESRYVKVLIDEIFGEDSFQREIVWRIGWVSGYKSAAKNWIRNHETLLFYTKSPKSFTFNKLYVPYPPGYQRRGEEGDPSGKGYPMEDVWNANQFEAALAGVQSLDSIMIKSFSSEKAGYDTQKPVSLVRRIVEVSSNPGDLVLDAFVGSGTAAVAAEQLGRRWIAVDIGRFAIHTTRKRLLDIRGCKPFVVTNLGRYERQVWQQETTGAQLSAYLDFIVDLYGASRLDGFRTLHGSRGPRAVHVGAVDAPVTLAEVREALEEAATGGYPGLDVLGWEWEMGLHELVQEEAKSAGVDLLLRRIPREVMDPRAVKSGEVVFHELAYLKVDAHVRAGTVRVTLADFVLPTPELVPVTVRDKIRSWSDYVDYWAVDFTFGEEGETDTFRNQWQSYRTRADRTLHLTAEHDYAKPGRYVVLVKVVDIFGNDTTTAVEVAVS